MIRHTHQTSPQHMVVAYSDNASVMEGQKSSVLARAARPDTVGYQKRAKLTMC
jgi:phosphoribosylformylglycinamidine synthase